MKEQDYKIIVGLYLRGDDLDPESVSQALGIKPSTSQYKGERKVTSTNREFFAKIGMWGLVSDLSSCLLSEHITYVTSQVKDGALGLRDIAGTQEAYVDVFIASEANVDGEGTCEFELSKENLSALEKIGLPVRFTVTLVRE